MINHIMYLLKNLDFSTCNERHLWEKRISTTKQSKAGEFSFFCKVNTNRHTCQIQTRCERLHLFHSLLFVLI
jgi:hypothetical protein